MTTSALFYPSSNIPYNLQFPAGQGRTLLSGLSGSSATLMVTLDDGSGRQKWMFNPVYTTSATVPAYYDIVISGGGTSGTYLSCTSNGSTIDLTSKDDGSGRQRWILAPVASATATTFSIQVQSGVSISGSAPPYYIIPNGSGGVAFTTSLPTAQQWQIKICPKYT